MSSKKQPTQSKLGRNLANMGVGGISGTFALTFVYPLETVKTMIQMQSEAGQSTSFGKILKQRIQSKNLMSLYKGMPAAWCRQFFFASLRIGLYYNYSDYLLAKQKKTSLSALESTLGSLAAGAIGISAVMPFDVIFVRFQAENVLPPAQRRGYTSLGNAMTRIIREEGPTTLWRGIIPAIGRAMSLNLGMLVPFDMCKKLLAPYFGLTKTNVLLSSAVAGLGASFCSLPFDNAKVKMQSMKAAADGKMKYSGLLDCMVKTVRNEGLFKLWVGFLPFYAVIGPHSMLTLIFNDAIKSLLGMNH